MVVLPARSGWAGAGSFDILQDGHGRIRQRDLFRRLFESVLRRCIEERLVRGEKFAVDGSLIKANR
ncbi:hypothetical protein IVB15_19490 [Bradyrhizobium sp. 182]|uniref:hypothetical protein n=1 Tax=Bradyrhizobium sp. 182 TaxID=2782651 RepID=UPI001FF73986|nr:hypothetical protein [Bradyrhizobium sp. 182]MCK1529843.1 hypothetical protein [Bradyrhizobium sp. 182]